MTETPAPLPLLLVRTGEIWLKGKNRNLFFNRLRKNLQTSLSAELRGAQVQPTYAKFFVSLSREEDIERALAICSDTPGVVSTSLVLRVAPEVEAITAAALSLIARYWSGQGSFAVQSKRTFKAFPLSSPDLNREVGGRIKMALGFPVDLKHPDRVVGVELNQSNAHVWVQASPGVGGLPIGSAGRVALLLSGGIDSPVAGYLAQKRGCELDAVYFHSPPLIGAASKDKVVELARKLAPRQGGLRLHVVHFTDIQKAIKANCDARFTVLLYRRFMYRIAAQIAHQRRAIALCTGENLGQVASQTLENLTLVDRLTDLLTLRPLISYDKMEIVAIARHIGTFETSALPFEDCCTLFVPKNPATKAPLHLIEVAEKALDIDALVADAIARTEVVAL